jgi:hypothetical protein
MSTTPTYKWEEARTLAHLTEDGIGLGISCSIPTSESNGGQYVLKALNSYAALVEALDGAREMRSFLQALHGHGLAAFNPEHLAKAYWKGHKAILKAEEILEEKLALSATREPYGHDAACANALDVCYQDHEPAADAKRPE